MYQALQKDMGTNLVGIWEFTSEF